MKLSLENSFLHKKYGDEKTIRMIKEAGFDGVDYSYCFLEEWEEPLGDHYVEYAYKVRALLDEVGLVCCQAHAPLTMSYGLDFDESVDGYKKIVRAIESAAILGAEYIVIHALKVPAGVDDHLYNLEYYKTFEPYCKKFGIRIAIENLMRRDEKRNCSVGRYHTPEALYKMLKALDSSWYVVCVDTGHAAIAGLEPEELIAGLDNSVLRCLHVHDNDYQKDKHSLPYTGEFNWNNICEALKGIGYTGYFSLEIPAFLRRFDDEIMLEVLKFVAVIGKYLANKIEN